VSRTHVVIAGLLLVGLLALAGCGPRVPSEPPAIAGRIVSVTPTLGANTAGPADSGAILVEGAGTVGDKAWITASRTTPILRQIKDGAVTTASFADLEAGMRVSVWITGPVRESYPVQAEASTILIVD